MMMMIIMIKFIKKSYLFSLLLLGTIVGLYSNYTGRRVSIVGSAIMVGAFIPLWIYAPDLHSLRFGAFTLQFFIQVKMIII